jgi:hypothetical protein
MHKNKMSGFRFANIPDFHEKVKKRSNIGDIRTPTRPKSPSILDGDIHRLSVLREGASETADEQRIVSV